MAKRETLKRDGRWIPLERFEMPKMKANILIVDDEPALRRSLSQIFIACGYGVATAEDGVSALHAIQREHPDLIVSDLKMPGMSGFELLAIVRGRYPAIKVVATSGTFSGNNIPHGVVADAFYPKGGGMHVLLQIIERMTAAGWVPSRLPIEDRGPSRKNGQIMFGAAGPGGPSESSEI